MIAMKVPSHRDEVLRERIIKYLRAHGSITNRECREHLGTTYDESIAIFNHMLARNDIVRLGKSSGTHYEIAP